MNLGNKLSRVLAVDAATFSVRLQFTGGVVGTISLRALFDRPKGLAAEILRGNLFGKCFVESGALAWPNGYELCPDVLRQWLDIRPVVRQPRRSLSATRSSRRARALRGRTHRRSFPIRLASR